MLVITRTAGTSFYIGESKVIILDISKNKVKIGIEAPKNIKILREELYTRPEKLV